VAVHFTAQMGDTTPAGLLMNFTSPVNPRIATEPGKVRLVFTREPLVPPSSLTLTFDSKTIPSATYEEDNGAAEITINTHIPLFASFSNDGRTITLAPAPQIRAAEKAPAAGEPAAVAPSAQGVAAPPRPPGIPAPTLPAFAIIDAAHGGEEFGAALPNGVFEKEVTLALAERLRQQLEAGHLVVTMVRDGDKTVQVAQRAALGNQARPKIYICLHATSMGHGVRIYTSLLPPEGANNGPFISWNTAQAGSLTLSRGVADSISSQLAAQRIPARVLGAPLRPLNEIAAPALAVELAPGISEGQDLGSQAYQDLVARSVANAVLQSRVQLEAPR
jgi:N-acetylmuramoyl-L-alanine amidase